MKILINLLLITIMIIACSSNDNTIQSKDPIVGKWELVKIQAPRIRNEITNEDIPYKEFYLFNSDGTFTKTRIEDGKTQSITGTYTKENTNDWEHLKLVYAEDSQLIDNCTGKPEEHLAISPGELKGGSAPCDGPALFYAPVQSEDR
ncbi:lipocalin family protein [Mangrovivirga cuniculi]|uniref:Uncharacterized protein n=1 Tax=Mangrovivirga cuniculi TaxID=2715131 RepID=A0A4D7JTH1_9BACT|nr:lipocalin family protein [Mangrovivirga cuniculi]QCK16830.1 hypothetical protein DCC35_19870 [Mangrovivirga cuniculi]